jgi:hypothetical protein
VPAASDTTSVAGFAVAAALTPPTTCEIARGTALPRIYDSAWTQNSQVRTCRLAFRHNLFAIGRSLHQLVHGEVRFGYDCFDPDFFRGGPCRAIGQKELIDTCRHFNLLSDPQVERRRNRFLQTSVGFELRRQIYRRLQIEVIGLSIFDTGCRRLRYPKPEFVSALSGVFDQGFFSRPNDSGRRSIEAVIDE